MYKIYMPSKIQNISRQKATVKIINVRTLSNQQTVFFCTTRDFSLTLSNQIQESVRKY